MDLRVEYSMEGVQCGYPNDADEAVVWDGEHPLAVFRRGESDPHWGLSETPGLHNAPDGAEYAFRDEGDMLSFVRKYAHG